MGEGIYGALQGAKAQMRYLDIIANNLANSETVGFKADQLQFGQFMYEAEFDKGGGPVLEHERRPDFANHQGVESPFVKITGQSIDLSQGNMRQTGNVLDVAIDGPGFFKVRAEDGQIFYTRDGRFKINTDGQLTHQSGGLILDDGDQPIRLSGNGIIGIDPDGTVRQNGAEQGMLGRWTMPDAGKLSKAGHTLFSYDETNAPPIADSDSRVRQGFVEGSNVNPIAEMTRMIQANRHFEYMNKLITAHRETDQRSISDVGATR